MLVELKSLIGDKTISVISSICTEIEIESGITKVIELESSPYADVYSD